MPRHKPNTKVSADTTLIVAETRGKRAATAGLPNAAPYKEPALVEAYERGYKSVAPAQPEMGDFDAAMIAEGAWELTSFEENEENFIAANQRLIDTGMAWKLQGSFGRQAMALIEAGHCRPAMQKAA